MRRIRKEQVAESRELIVTTARKLFSENTYESVNVRRLADAMGRTTGVIFAHFETKEDLWRAVMHSEPPVDSPLTRHAPELERALRQLVRLQAIDDASPEAWRRGWADGERALRRLDDEAGRMTPSASPAPAPAPPSTSGRRPTR